MWFKLIAIIVFGAIAVVCMKKMSECILDIQALWHEAKHPGSLPRSEGGIVFNKKTGKLEETPRDVLLPFD